MTARVIADSTNPDGVRLTTVEVRFHRFVLAEFNTHRVLSKNSASSRAIPVSKQLDRVRDDPALPVSWPEEQKGMQGGESLPGRYADMARIVWLNAAKDARERAQTLVSLRAHKSLTNRLLEPFMWHTAVVTGTAWENFFAQRCSPLAQPEIRAAAEAMRTAMNESVPNECPEGSWHLPYIDDETADEANGDPGVLTRVSAARCARVSYLTQDGQRSIQADLELYERLVTAKPAHWSPLEHVATPWAQNRQIEDALWWIGRLERRSVPTGHLPRVGNLLGWRSLRIEVESDRGEVTYR